jgi:hypothetical protein
MAPLILKLGNIEMSGQFHAPAVFFFSGRKPRKAPEAVRMILGEKNVLPLTGFEPRTDQRVA